MRGLLSLKLLVLGLLAACATVNAYFPAAAAQQAADRIIDAVTSQPDKPHAPGSASLNPAPTNPEQCSQIGLAAGCRTAPGSLASGASESGLS
jgi:hypothetical protein